MNSAMLVDIWSLIKENVDKKNIETVAESYIDICADYGADDQVLREAQGTCDNLDKAIDYYLDETEEDQDDFTDDSWAD